MPRLPKPTIPWRFRSSVSCNEATDLDHRARILFEIKQSMTVNATGWTDSTGASVSPTAAWNVVASSDSITADGSDRWPNIGSLVWGTDPAAHSWIVLEHPNLFGAGLPGQICFDCSQSAAAQRSAALGVFVSRQGFNVGAPVVTTRPTAPDELQILPTNGTTVTAPWQGPATNDAAHQTGRLHFMMSDDARYVRWFIARSGVCIGMGDMFPVPDYDIATEWNRPRMTMVYSFDADLERLTWDNARADTTFVYRGSDGVIGDFLANHECPQSTGADTASVNQPAITFNNAYGLRAIGLAGQPPLSGAFAGVPDQWWGNALVRNQTFPSDASRQFVQFGDRLTPWDRSIPLFS